MYRQTNGPPEELLLSKFLSKAKIEGPARSKLRSEHADASAVADFMDAIEDIDHVKSHRRRPHLAVPFDVMVDASVDLGEERKLAGVGKTISQAAAVDHIGAETCAIP